MHGDGSALASALLKLLRGVSAQISKSPVVTSRNMGAGATKVADEQNGRVWKTKSAGFAVLRNVSDEISRRRSSMRTAKRPLARSNSVLVDQKLTHTLSFRENFVEHKLEDIWKEYDMDSSGQNRGVLGSGVCGKVYKIRSKQRPKAVYAMKTVRIKSMSQRQLKELQTEVEVLKFVNHCHIARLYECFESGTEKVSRCDIRKALN